MFYSYFSNTNLRFLASICTVLSLCFAYGCTGVNTATDTQWPKGVFNVRDYGAIGDGATLDTKAIQAAIDACTRAGGGKVYLNNGIFLSGTIYLKDNATLYLEAGSVLLGSSDLKDYSVNIPTQRSYTDDYTNKSLIYAEKAENIAVMGCGIIDGQGAAFKGLDQKALPHKSRPFLMRIVQCKNVTVKDVTIQNSPMWVTHYLACENVNIDGISIHSRVNNNNDGIDIDGCEKVRISNCEINSGDDCIVLKSTSNRSCRNVTITNCVLSTKTNALKMGTESNGGFENITINNCAIYDTGMAGIALMVVDGGKFDRVNIANITMENVGSAIFIRLGNRARSFKEDMKKPGVGLVRNIIISNVQATGVSSTGSSITGIPGYPVENVTLKNIRIISKGGGTVEHSNRQIPVSEEKHPNNVMFGTLPAYGFYCRYVKNLKFHSVDLGFEKDDHRPAVIFDNVSDLDVFDFDADSLPSAQALIWLKQTDSVFIHGCSPRDTAIPFVRLDGDKSQNISLMNNDLSKVRQVLEKGKELEENIVYLGNNRTK